MTLKELKGLCRDMKLKLGGRKAELVERVLNSENQDLQFAQMDRLVEAQAAEDMESGVMQEEYAVATSGDEANVSKHSSDYDDDPDEVSTADKLVEALDRGEFDEDTLEQIFNLEVPQLGDIVTGTVTSLVEWGAFVELDETGWMGLLHISEISDEFLENIEDYIHPGQKVEVMVIKSNKSRADRISLSMKRVAKARKLSLTDVKNALNKPVEDIKSPETSSPTNKLRRVKGEEFDRLELRITAIEMVLHSLGYSKVLRGAREEAFDGTKKLAMPSLEELLAPPQNEAKKVNAAENAEKQAIDEVLRDLMTPRERDEELGGEDLESIDLDSVLSSGEDANQDGGGQGNRSAGLIDSEGASETEPLDIGSLDAEMADMLSDSFATSTYTETSSLQKHSRQG